MNKPDRIVHWIKAAAAMGYREKKSIMAFILTAEEVYEEALGGDPVEERRKKTEAARRALAVKRAAS